MDITSEPSLHRLSRSDLDLAYPTPVRIRGKKRPKESRDKSISQTPSVATGQPKRFRQGYPHNVFSAISRPTRRHHQRSNILISTGEEAPKRTTVKRQLSRLETLPTEILEQVFFYCLEPTFDITLVRASPLIGARLSSDFIFHEYCRRAFCHVIDTDGVQYTIRKGAPPVWDQDIVHGRDQALRCRWMTWDFYNTMCCRTLDEGEEFIRSLKYLKEIQRFGKCQNLAMSLKCSRIPSKLLRVPFSDDQVLFLDSLSHSNATLDRTNSTNAEAAVDLFRAAVKEKEWHLITSLLRRPMQLEPDPMVLRDAIAETQYDTETIWHIHRELSDATQRYGHDELCQRIFPYSDPQVMAVLRDRSARCPGYYRKAPRCFFRLR